MKDEDPLNRFLGDFLVQLDTVRRDDVRENGNADPSRKNAEALKDIFERQDFRSLLQLFSIVSDYRLKCPQSAPLSTHLALLVNEVCTACRERPFMPQVQELLHCLNRPHVQALFAAHDQIANRQYEPRLPDIPFEVDEDEGTAVKIVCLVKNNEPLGATIKVDEKTGAVVIARILHGGVASRCSCMGVGDRLLEVNNTSVTGLSAGEIVRLLSASTGNLVFKLVPAPLTGVESPSRQVASASDLSMVELPRESKVFLRALFDYNPKDDALMPCTEAALEFRRGDVLRVVDQTDANWWQAVLVAEAGSGGFCAFDTTQTQQEHRRTGIIPSKLLQEKRQLTTPRASDGGSKSTSSEASPASSPAVVHHGLLGASTCGSARRVKKVMYETRASDDFEHDATASTYEEVARLYPPHGERRVVVLIGPPGVGRNELKRRLLMLNPMRFATTIPHTSRQPRAGEAEGNEYHFVTRVQMEAWIQQGRFIEYGEYKGNLYGTLVDTVRAIVAPRSQVAVLNPHQQALRHLRTPEMKAFVVFVKPPPFTALRETREQQRARSTVQGAYARGFTDDELQAMLRSARRLEETNGHNFDYTLVNGNLDAAFRELCDVLERVETEVTWVPAQWVR